MKKIVLIGLILTGALNLFGQDISFDFTATRKASVQMGKDWDFSYTALNTPLKISFSDNKLLMVYESGKVFWELDVIKPIKTKETIENGKVVEQHIALEYQEDGFTSYILYEYKNDDVSERIKLKLPLNMSGWVFSYNNFSN